MVLMGERSRVWKDAEKALGTVGKLRIMRELLRESERTRSRYVLKKSTRLKLQSIKKHLEVLVKLGWVVEIPYQPKKYKANMENLAVRAFQRFCVELDRVEMEKQRLRS